MASVSAFRRVFGDVTVTGCCMFHAECCGFKKTTAKNCIFFFFVLQFHVRHFHVLLFHALRFYVLEIHVLQFRVLQF